MHTIVHVYACAHVHVRICKHAAMYMCTGVHADTCRCVRMLFSIMLVSRPPCSEEGAVCGLTVSACLSSAVCPIATSCCLRRSVWAWSWVTRALSLSIAFRLCFSCPLTSTRGCRLHADAHELTVDARVHLMHNVLSEGFDG